MLRLAVLTLAAVGASGLHLRAPEESSASGPAPMTLADHVAKKEEIKGLQMDNEKNYAATKTDLKTQHNDAVANIQNAKREILEKSLDTSTEDNTKAKEDGEKAAATKEETAGEQEPSEAEKKAQEMAKASAKAACEGGGKADKSEPSAEEQAKIDEAAATAQKKSEEELVSAKDKVETMHESATAHVEVTQEKVEVHRETLEAAKSVKGGCKKDCPKKDDAAAAAPAK